MGRVCLRLLPPANTVGRPVEGGTVRIQVFLGQCSGGASSWLSLLLLSSSKVDCVFDLCPHVKKQTNKQTFWGLNAVLRQDGVSIDGDSALITFKQRSIAERVKKVKSGKNYQGKTMLIRWKEILAKKPTPQSSESV